MAESRNNSSSEEILEHLKQLERRITRLEERLELSVPEREEKKEAPTFTAESEEEAEEALELRVGQNWFAKVGIVVLALGIVFLLTIPFQNLPPILPSLVGYVLVGFIVWLSRIWRDSYPQISRYMMGGGLLLLYFSTLRLSHFGPEPAVTSVVVEFVLLSAVVAFNVATALRRQSVYLAGINIGLGYLTALAGRDPFIVFSSILIISCLAAFIGFKFKWSAIFTVGIVLSYLTHFLWSMNNPLFGNPLQQVTSPQINVLFVLLYAGVFAAGLYFSGKSREDSIPSVTNVVLNGFGSYSLLLLLSITAFKAGFGFWHVAASLIYLGFAVLVWTRERSKYTTFVYAMLGYMALSVAIADTFKMPDLFVWLSWQSVLVVATAVWFRSRFIIVGNFGIYLIVFGSYLILAGAVSGVSLSFGVVALISARILNWKRERLELKTEMMRNAYLASALFVLPYAMYHTVPPGYVSLSWLCLALFYYLTSLLLKHNRKYRWMALLTTLLTIGHVFLVDLVGLEPAYRILSFLVLGSALLTISMVYSRRKSHAKSVGA
jgi:uncharacterized membrane protein